MAFMAFMDESNGRGRTNALNFITREEETDGLDTVGYSARAGSRCCTGSGWGSCAASRLTGRGVFGWARGRGGSRRVGAKQREEREKVGGGGCIEEQGAALG